MHTFPSLKNLPISTIQTENTWNLRPFLPPHPPKNLYSSLADLSLIHPPIVIDLGNETYHLLTGQNRLTAFCSVFPGKTSIPVVLLQESDNQEKIFHYLLTDRIHSSHFSSMEKAYFFKHCLQHMDIETASHKFLPPMQEKAQPHIITKLLSLCNLEPELQQSIHFEQITLKLGLELLSLSKEDRKTLHTLFKQFEFGGGKQKRLLSLCQDLAGRNQTTITRLLAGKEYADIIKHSAMNTPQKGASLLTLLDKQLYPESNRAEEEFNKRVEKMQLAPSFSVEHSPAFEKDAVQLRVTFASLAQLEQQIATVKKLQQSMD